MRNRLLEIARTALVLIIVYVIVVGLSVLIAGPANDIYAPVVCGIGFVAYFTAWLFIADIELPKQTIRVSKAFVRYSEYLDTSVMIGTAVAFLIFIVAMLHHAVFFTLETATPLGIVLTISIAAGLAFYVSGNEDLRSFSENRIIETICLTLSTLLCLALVNGIFRTIASANSVSVGILTFAATIAGFVGGYFEHKSESCSIGIRS